jgi:hypothetical protein
MRFIETGRLRQLHPLVNRSPRLNFPNDLKLFAFSIIFYGRQRNQVLWRSIDRTQRIARQGRFPHISDYEMPLSNCYELSWNRDFTSHG